MKAPKSLKPKHTIIALILPGLLLLIAIAFTTVKLLSVYNSSGLIPNQLLQHLLIASLSVAALILYLSFLLYLLLRQQQHTRFLLAHDSLTGLKSRAHILQAITKLCRREKPFTLINLDLNQFKQINDQHGHQTGDQVLLYIAALFKKTLAQHGEVGRVGGDEFLWVTDTVDQDEVNQLYSQLLHYLQRSFITDNNAIIQLSISAGAGLAADYDFHDIELRDAVDKAMYQAKNAQLAKIVWQSA